MTTIPETDREPSDGAMSFVPGLHLAAEAFRGLAGEFVRTIEPHSEADPAGLLVSFLVGFGAASGLGPHALADGAEHPARLFAVLVGETSKARKGTSWNQVRRLLLAADPTLSDRIMNGFGSGESLIEAVGNSEENSGSPLELLDSRLLVVDPEWSRILAVGSRDGATLSQILREAWDGQRLEVRTRTRRSLVADRSHLCLIGHITLEELRRTLTRTEMANGFANRHLFVSVSRSKLLPSGGNLDEASVSRLGSEVRERLQAAQSIGTLKRTPEAEELWATRYREMAEDEPGGLLGAIVGRDQAQVLRLSVTYALLNGSRWINTEDVESAWAVWRYCRASAESIFGNSFGDAVADRILQAVKEAGPRGLDRTYLRDLFGRHRSATEIDRAVALLEERGRIDVDREPTKGRSRAVLRPKRPNPDPRSLSSLKSLEHEVGSNRHSPRLTAVGSEFRPPTDEEVNRWAEAEDDYD
jgi:Protein of unknown function (DUF3987)